MHACPCECHGRWQHPCSIQGGCGHLHNPRPAEPARAEMLPKPFEACVLCRPPAPGQAWNFAESGYVTCRPCWQRLRRHLRGLSERYARLNPRPGVMGETGGRGAPGFVSAPPANLHIVAIRDHRSTPDARVWLASDGRVHRESERPPLSTYAELDKLAAGVIAARGFEHGHGQASVAGLCWWFDQQLEWITAQTAVIMFARHLRKLLGQLKPATGDDRFWIANCPNTIDEGAHTRTCGANLFVPQRGNVITCGKCGRDWPRDKWDGDSPDSLAQLVKDRRLSA